jgi:hypothetical protein
MPSHAIYTAGYARWTPDALAAKVAELGAMLIDTRYVPWAKNPDFRRETLEDRFGESYLWVRALGNVNYRGGPIELAAPDEALPLLASILAERPVVLLCVCADASRCHRAVAAAFLQARLGGEIVHLEPPSKNAGASILGLTLHRPWPWAMLHAWKRVENRGWMPPRDFIGGYIAIHAGQKWDAEGATWLQGALRNAKLGSPAEAWDAFPVQVPPAEEHPSGVIVGVARLIGVIRETPDGEDMEVVAMAEGHTEAGLLMGCDYLTWFFGPLGWVLEDVTPIELVKCPGAQRLWALPSDVLAQVRAGYAAARREKAMVSA